MDDIQKLVLEQRKSDILVGNNAQTIYDHLKELKILGGDNEKRWLWELFQNAKDSVEENQNVKIELEIKEDSLIFKHNGNPFTQDEIIHLIYHGSSKKDLLGKTGKFGTGFLTTHLLSKIVEISGVLEEGKNFSFNLSREGSNSEELKDAMERSWNEFLKNIDSKSSNSNFTTQFTYILNESGKLIVKKIFDKLECIIPFVLTFIGNIESVIIKRDDTKIEFKVKANAVDPDYLNISKVFISKIENNKEKIEYYIITYSNDEFSIALNIEINERGDRYFSNLNKFAPKLFYSFPLLGTENFPFPFLLNSTNFAAKSERDGVYLGDKKETENEHNKEILKNAYGVVIEFLKYLIKERVYDLHKLLLLDIDFNKDWVDVNWLKELIKDFFNEELYELELVTLEDNNLIKINDSVFSFSDYYEESWSLLYIIFRNKIAKKDHLEDWVTIWSSIFKLIDNNYKDTDGFFDIEKICEFVSLKKNISELKKEFNENEDDSIAWICNIIQTVIKIKRPYLLDTYSILPNQNSDFCKQQDLAIDIDISEEIKSIGKSFGHDIRKELLDPRISLLNEHLKNHNNDDIIPMLLPVFIESKSIISNPQIYVEAFRYFISLKKTDYIENFWVVTQKLNDDKKLTIKKLNHEQRLFPPFEKMGIQEYEGLFPSEFILSSTYYGSLSIDEIQFLAKAGLLYENVFEKFTTTLDKEMLENITINNEYLEIEKEHETKEMLITNISFLELQDKGIKDVARKSYKKTLLFLEFIFKYLIFKDNSWKEVKSVECSCGKKHNIHPSYWLNYLKKVQWVFSKEGGEKPSSTSLSKYFEDSETLRAQLDNDLSIDFLEILGVSISDLMKNIYTKSYESRREYDKLFRQIISKKLDPSKISLMINEPKILHELEEKYRLGKIVKRNQDIGAQIELLFQNVFRQQYMVEQGFIINRTGIGSDYEIEFDIVIDDEEKYLNIEKNEKKFLVEIKSCRSDFVRMTETQGKTAVKEHNNFALCVVSFSNEEYNEDLILQNSWFVINIGNLIIEKVKEVEDLKLIADEVRNPQKEISVEILDSQIKYIINDTVWLNGLSFSEFIEFLKS